MTIRAYCLRTERKKRWILTFVNNLYTPQYLKLRYLGIPETWEVKGGKEQCVGLEHWHGSSNVNSIDFTFTPHGPYTAKTEIVLEISVNGRGEKMYVPADVFSTADSGSKGLAMDINDKEKQIEELIEKMTTEEKVAQTLQLSYQSMSAENSKRRCKKACSVRTCTCWAKIRKNT